ncbi:type III polyketide synthase [Bacillus lacus]|uniref:Type III polyketide synthase n=1 Tax=Metabacillus lacus TaxID=1983721 RepID=A0A7X2IWB7_9BACI|nr:3-oxoacyl-[acyl-carrier-protein] synthase III C-terminal domain-containing protein [Metabacillus lacus]MRX70935.1 type III polyketide synthase [Metabacillus lacus]
MGYILSVGKGIPEHEYQQDVIMSFAREKFKDTFKDIDRLLKAFKNGEIKKRQFVETLSWYQEDHSFKEKNNTYIEHAVRLSVSAIKNCLTNQKLLKKEIQCEEIDAIFFVSSTGISTPSIDAKIINNLPFKETIKRMPIWGLGCAGGASGLSRAFDYCEAYPEAKVLVVCVELCSLTFQHDDHSKSNFIGTSLFADGTACTLIAGKKVNLSANSSKESLPEILATRSVFMKSSEEVMGWDIKDNGFYVIFSRDIPSIISKWLKPAVEEFLSTREIELHSINHFLAHPGGKKVLDAYKDSLGFDESALTVSQKVLENHGNMSAVTVMYVIADYLEQDLAKTGEKGLIGALGPGFCGELLAVQWEAVT